MWKTALVMEAESVRSKRPLAMISLEMKTTSRRTAKRCSLMPRIIWPSTKAAAGALCISSLTPQAWRRIGYVEVLVAIEDFLGVVGVGAAVQDGEGAFAEQRVETAGAGVQELADLVLGEVFEGAAGADAGVYEFRD